ncbi:putative beta-glucosidase M [Fulvia fulva]|uniref:beta-glucosidase n=1 Tax=Passalora fulva TaxID=5499 RepID=A0A9Q8UUN7_PASFU|nr:putative beta-glucosidase M [Fulvia fulva]KAK4627434.1 putative beta-glucosidase M [Fulvia fulva]UJO23154.1 putative beta-glucosidase M [Fulvia fulva]WPV28746.1 putative beta-glucosidase M [Fulvia fulva]
MKAIAASAGALLSIASSANALSYTNASEVHLYGQSPPVYPTPEGNGGVDAAWQDAYDKARALVEQMTLIEKVNMTRGHTGTCVGNTPAIDRLGINALCFADAPDGIRGQESSPTFDRDLMHRYGVALGEEYRGKGINIALLPVAGPLGRKARGGRNWEGFGADPFLSSIGMGEVTTGLQEQGVIAQMKHWLLNEQEWRRNPGIPQDIGEAMSSNADDRTIHELYAFPFMDSLKAGAASAMCSYQRVNNSYGCQNSKLLNGILKTELGFQGFVTSDWAAQHAGVASANAGLDLVMPDGGYWGDNLTQAVTNGSVAKSRLDDMVTRILAAWYHLGQDQDFPEVGVYNYDQQHAIIDVRGDHASLIREIGAAGAVLVMNENNALPLQKPRFLNIYGYDAKTPDSPWTTPARFGGGYDVNFGWEILNGTLVTGGGSGSNTPSYLISPFEAIQRRVIEDRGMVRWDFASVNPTVYANADACLVFINAYASESFDRTSLTHDWSDQLVKNMATNCSNTIVVIHSAGIRVVDEWIDHPNVTAVIYGLLPGQDTGNSIVDILYGDVSPSGRLPFTVAKKEKDYGDLLNSTISSGPFPQDNFTEGLYIDYRHFDKYNITPRYEFGFGLSYSDFSYSDLVITKTSNATSEYPAISSPIPQGGHAALWDVIIEVSVNITNTGAVAAAEVPQLYVEIPDAPKNQLRGFERVKLEVAESKTATFQLKRRDLSIWEVVAQEWKLQSGRYPICVGASSRDVKLMGQFEI